MWRDLLVASALLLILEGILPFVHPEGVRKFFAAVTQMSDSVLRFAGLTSMLIGILLLYAVYS